MAYKRLSNKEYIDLLGSELKIQLSTDGYGLVDYSATYCKDRNTVIILFYSEIKPSFFGVPVSYYKNLDFEKRKIKLKTTSKFIKVFNKVKTRVREDVQRLIKQNPLAQIEIIGSKFGSVLAQMAAQDLYANYGFRSHLITFESIPVWFGNKDAKYYLEKSCKGEPNNVPDSTGIAKFYPFFPGYFCTEEVLNKK